MADTISVFSPDGMSRNNNAVRRGIREDNNNNVGAEEKHPLNIQSRVFFVLQSAMLNSNGRYSGYVVNPVPDEDVNGTGTRSGFLATYNDDGAYDFVEVIPPPFGQKMVTNKMYEGVVVGCTDYDIVPIIATSNCEPDAQPSTARIHMSSFGILNPLMPLSENQQVQGGYTSNFGLVSSWPSIIIRPGQKLKGHVSITAAYRCFNGTIYEAGVDVWFALVDSSGYLINRTEFTSGSVVMVGGIDAGNGINSGGGFYFYNPGTDQTQYSIGRQTIQFPFVITNAYKYFPSYYGTTNYGLAMYFTLSQRNYGGIPHYMPGIGFSIIGSTIYGYDDGVQRGLTDYYPVGTPIVPPPIS